MKFDAWYARFLGNYDRYLNDLADFGVETAQQIFDSAPAEYGNGGVSVSKEMQDKGFIVRATGDDAMFIEFGTGVEVAITRPTVQSSVPIEPGSYSRENTGEFDRYGSWHYQGVKYIGTPPMGAMQTACQKMQDWSSTIAGRAFK